MIDKRTKYNSGYAAYIGRKRIAWSLSCTEVVEAAQELIKRERTVNRFVPSITIFDCSQILVVGFVTDDSNGITVHGRNSKCTPLVEE